jgi:L-lactate dehydrogenase complex protein LldE
MIRHGYPALFLDQHRVNPKDRWLDRARALAGRTYEFSEFLVDICHRVDFGAVFPGPVTYHASCHLLRDLGVHRQPIALLSSVRDARFEDQTRSLELRQLSNYDECCGFGGVFSVEHGQLSAAMVKRKIEAIRDTGATIVVCCDAGCLANIAGALVHQNRIIAEPSIIKVIHLAQILASDSSTA